MKESVQNSVKISIADDEHPLSYLFGTYAMEGILISQGQASPNGYDVTIAAHDAGALNEIEVDFGYPEVVLASVGEEDGETVITFYKNQDVGEAQAGYIAHFVWTTVEDGKQYYSETDNVMMGFDFIIRFIFTVQGVQFPALHIEGEWVAVYTVHDISFAWNQFSVFIKYRFVGIFIMFKHEITLYLCIAGIFTCYVFQDCH